MSRVAKKPIPLPKGVEIQIADGSVKVKGPKGELSTAMPTGLGVKIEGSEAQIEVAEGGNLAMGGTLRALLANMVTGVSEGYQRRLDLVGVGYRAQMQGADLSLALGFSHPVVFKAPEGVTLEVPSQTEILVKGTDKQAVGQAAAKIRAFRPPEPYKGKGVRYHGERITIKEAKKA